MPSETDPLHKVTIIPREKALGVTYSLPDREKHTISKDEMTARIMVALGGRAAEELIFNRLESGAHSDFVTATEVARAMICLMVCQKSLGPVVYKQEYGEYAYSEETARKIDDEVRSIMDSCYKQVMNLLSEQSNQFRTCELFTLERDSLCWRDLPTLRKYPSRRTISVLADGPAGAWRSQ